MGHVLGSMPSSHLTRQRAGGNLPTSELYQLPSGANYSSHSIYLQFRGHLPHNEASEWQSWQRRWSRGSKYTTYRAPGLPRSGCPNGIHPTIILFLGRCPTCCCSMIAISREISPISLRLQDPLTLHSLAFTDPSSNRQLTSHHPHTHTT